MAIIDIWILIYLWNNKSIVVVEDIKGERCRALPNYLLCNGMLPRYVAMCAMQWYVTALCSYVCYAMVCYRAM